MRNALLLLTVAVLLCACNVYMLMHRAAPNLKKLGAIVRLVDASGHTFCTGTIVDDRTLITANHCAEAALFCTQLTYDKGSDFAWSMKGVLIPGMSGGPVLYNGRLVAVNSRVNGDNCEVNPPYNMVLP